MGSTTSETQEDETQFWNTGVLHFECSYWSHRSWPAFLIDNLCNWLEMTGEKRKLYLICHVHLGQ